jgi:hypothetical protein
MQGVLAHLATPRFGDDYFAPELLLHSRHYALESVAELRLQRTQVADNHGRIHECGTRLWIDGNGNS